MVRGPIGLVVLCLAACGVDPRADDDVQASVPFQSCEGLPATCGPTGDASCCEAIGVPGGSYFRSYDGVGYVEMQYPATVSAFALDRFEVTVGRFRRFVEAGRGTQERPPAEGAGARTLGGITGQGGWESAWDVELAATSDDLRASVETCGDLPNPLRTWTDAPGTNEQRPINGVSWYAAMAFCIWDGGYLPTEAEWNYVAAGGDEQRVFPWSVPPTSTQLDPSRTSYEDNDECWGDGLPQCTVTDFVLVGSKPAGNGKWGHADLSGNVREWALDWQPVYPVPCEDCAQLIPDIARRVRGGSLDDGPIEALRVGARLVDDPRSCSVLTGIRCARPSPVVQ